MSNRDYVPYLNKTVEVWIKNNNKPKKLVGDITLGYSYMDTDKAIEMSQRIKEYCKSDEEVVSKLYRDIINSRYGISGDSKTMEIKNVIFNYPATIVIWGDGSKTVVKCGEWENYDPEKGLAMAIAKRALGDRGNYYEVFKKWLPEEEPITQQSIKNGFDEFAASLKKFKDAVDKTNNKKD